MFGLRSVAGLVAELAEGSARRRDAARLERFLGEIRGRGGCNHPDGAVRMVASAVSTFAEDIDSHLHRGRCMHSGTDGFFPVPEVS
jgi:NADH:ubiquinone oxidoreductase subunit F (NADH-binding)